MYFPVYLALNVDSGDDNECILHLSVISGLIH